MFPEPEKVGLDLHVSPSRQELIVPPLVAIRWGDAGRLSLHCTATFVIFSIVPCCWPFLFGNLSSSFCPAHFIQLLTILPSANYTRYQDIYVGKLLFDMNDCNKPVLRVH